MTTRRGVAAACVALAFLCAAPRAAEAADPGARLAALRKEIAEREARARELGKQAEGSLGQIEAVDRELTETRLGAKLLRQREREAAAEAEAAKQGAANAARALAETERGLEARLVALYKWNATGGPASLWTASDLASFSRRREGLARIVAQDRALFERHARARATYQARRAESEGRLREVSDARKEAAEHEERARRQLVERRNMVALLRTRAAREEKAAGELRAAAQSLEDAIRRLPKSEPARASRAPDLASRSPDSSGSAAPVPGFSGEGLAAGRTPRPVGGRIRAGFGRQIDPEFKTQTLRTGVEIEAPAGTPVQAIAPGRVLFAGWFRGYGQMVIVDHGGGDLSVSGYLEEVHVAAGDSVAAGQPIGSVGETGSASGPGLYFEIRHDGKAVDPALWLAK